jgi:hypothetical protein
MRQGLLFFFLLVHVLCAADHQSCKGFHVCTVANYRHPNLEKLIQSCKKHRIELEVLGMGLPWFGNGTKFAHVRSYLNTLQDDEILLFVDAFDVLIVADKDTIRRKFLSMKVPFLLALEKGWWPEWEYENRFPPTKSSFKLLNTGTYIGYVGYLKRWLDAINPDPKECDQLQTVRHWRKPENMHWYNFDSTCEIFLPLYGVCNKDIKLDRDGVLHLLETNSTPCMIHANGSSWEVYNTVLYNQISKN